MTKIIKEVIIMLLVALAGMLLFAVLLYGYIPNKKSVPAIINYTASDEIKELIADDIDVKNEEIVKTFEVTSSDLINYKASKDYVAGKSNPFDATNQSPDAESSTDNPKESNTDSSSSSNTSTNNSSNSEEKNSKSNEQVSKTRENENEISIK